MSKQSDGKSSQVLHPRLLRGLSLIDATALVVGTIIGTGIFLKAAVMSQLLGTPWLVLLAWFFAGLLSLAGALTYAELGCLFPKAGGEYVYLREAYGDLPAFLYGWMRFWIAGPGSVAAFAVGAATFFSGVIMIESQETRTTLAVSLIILFTGLNLLSVSLGGKINTILTSIKVFLLLSVPMGAILFSPLATFANLAGEVGVPFNFGAFGTALVAALWAFDGWNNLPMMAGEVHKPEENVPKALIFGTLIVLLIYGLVNFSYFFTLPISEIAISSSKNFPTAAPVASKVVQSYLGSSGVTVFSLLLVVSALGAMFGAVMTHSRVPYALAKDGLFPKIVGEVSNKTHVPFVALIAEGTVAVLLALSGSFDQLTDYVVFASWIFYALVAFSIFIFRKKLPREPRAYKALGYPVIPAVFVMLAVLLVVNTLVQAPKESLLGLGLISSGIPVYFLFFHKKRRPHLHS